MLGKDTLRYSLYTGIVIAILTLTGIFGTFEGREVIEDQLDLAAVLLVIMVGGTGFIVASRVQERGTVAAITNGVIGSTLIGLILAAIIVLQLSISLSFVFQNLSDLNEGTLTFGQTVDLDTGEIAPLILLIAASAFTGVLAGVLALVPARLRDMLLIAAALTTVIGLTYNQIDDVMTLPDAISLLITFGASYGAARRLDGALLARAGAGVALGVGIGFVLLLIANNGGLEEGGILYGSGDAPVVLDLALSSAPVFLAVMGITGIAGALAVGGNRLAHDGSMYLVVFLLVLGILNWQDDMNLLATGMVFAILSLLIWFVPLLGQRAESEFEAASAPTQTQTTVIFAGLALAVMLVAPQFMGLYVSNVFNLIALYAIMGIGLNVMIGYTGLLDLGYVASFAIGAYTLGVLTTPNLLTCGGVHPNEIPFNELEAACTGTISFWAAWPFCVVFSALTGMALGIPVLRLRGDYLAIVTLGFGEIINRIITSNTFRPLLGGPQGISPIPTPYVNLSPINESWTTQLNSPDLIYYLFLFSLALTAFVVWRVANSRLGRAMRAVRADEDVAQAVGINLVNTKLMAFGVSSAFAGLGGAVFGASLQGIFPNSFTLLVSINVLSLIIIGGMGSIPGVILGAVILVGMPELLRELDAYRLLAFGALLVFVMLTKPDGLLPPKPPELAERAREYRGDEAANTVTEGSQA